jgi:chemotaxis protein CheD
MVSIQLGEYFATQEDMIIHTILGSCISVCLFVPGMNLTGINHFMLPANPLHNELKKPGQYGINAMELLFAEFVKKGINIKSLHAKVYGGGNITRTTNKENIGSNNIKFILEFLDIEKIPVIEKDVGGFLGRKVLFFTRTHEVVISLTRDMVKIKNEEKKYQNDLQKKVDSDPDITFFK